METLITPEYMSINIQKYISQSFLKLLIEKNILRELLTKQDFKKVREGDKIFRS